MNKEKLLTEFIKEFIHSGPRISKTNEFEIFYIASSINTAFNFYSRDEVKYLPTEVINVLDELDFDKKNKRTNYQQSIFSRWRNKRYTSYIL